MRRSWAQARETLTQKIKTREALQGEHRVVGFCALIRFIGFSTVRRDVSTWCAGSASEQIWCFFQLSGLTTPWKICKEQWPIWYIATTSCLFCRVKEWTTEDSLLGQ